MLGNRRPEGSSQGNCAEVSPLESLLQQAWLQSHRPKVQRRITSPSPLADVSLGRRSGSQSPSGVLSGRIPAQAVYQDGPEKLFFHKSRLDASTVFISRFALPELKCYSTKADIPRSVSLLQWNQPGSSGSGYGRPQALKSLGGSPTPSSESWTSTVRQFSGITESGDSSCGSVDFEGQTQPLASYLDTILMDENLEEEKSMLHETSAYQAMAKEISDLIGLDSVVEGEKSDVVGFDSCWDDPECCLLEKSSAYQAMAKEISDLISPNSTACDSGTTEVSNDEICVRVDFLPTEESAVRMMMEAYACVLSKHIADVSISSGYEETDTILIYVDEDWKLYLQNLNRNFKPTSNFDFNRLLCGAGRSKALGDNVVTSSACGTLTELLYRCALAVSQGNVQNATDLLAELRQNSSPQGNTTQRMAHYFMEALMAKMTGTGEQLYTVIGNNCPSAASVFKAVRLYFENNPYIKLSHFFSMRTILEACEGATRVHVIIYGIQYGTEFPSLMQQLARRPGGAPHLRITGIDYPYPGNDPALKINETGRRLAAFAKDCKVPFEFVALAGSWESFTARDMNLRDDEVLAVCSDRLHTLLDESVMATSPREVVLRRIRSMNPKVFVIIGENGGYNAPFFMTRFRECVKHYSALYDGMDLSMPPDDADRVIIEKEFFGRAILNIVACEGQARVERPEPYRQWQNRLQRAGFTLRPLNPNVFSKITAMMASFHKNYGVGVDDGWFLMGVNNEIVHACSVWEPRTSPSLHHVL
ncbi:hypothetical protein M758_10G098700 [Ceratodon purpureus]|nr:hypothetical protein M758_10G098700 [Ceratodon purpureus]